MKYISLATITILLVMGAFCESKAATLKLISTAFETAYSEATSYNDNFHSADSIDHAENYGVGVEMKLGVTNGLTFNVGYHYLPMRCREKDVYTAMTRTDYPYAPSYWSQLQTYINRKTLNGENPLYEVAYDYIYYMTYHHLNLGLEYQPLQTGMFRPFITAGITPILFGQKGYLVTDIKGNYEDANGNWLTSRRYKVRAHHGTRNKHRGYIFNGFIGGGFEVMIHKYVGIAVRGKYYRTIADNDRNRITGYYSVGAGFVVHNL